MKYEQKCVPVFTIAAAKMVELGEQNNRKLLDVMLSNSVPKKNIRKVHDLHCQSATVICMLLTYATKGKA